MSDVLSGIGRAIKWSHAYVPPARPTLVLPDHWDPSDVLRAARLAGAVEYRGHTITPSTDIRGLEGTP